MDATKVLSQDHRRVEDLFSRIEQASGPQQRQPLVEQLFEALSTHAEVEEEHFYPAVARAIDDEEMIREAVEEHHVVKVLLEEIAGMEADDEQLEAKLTVLKENVEHHVEEEEKELFKQARQAMDDRQLTAIGEELAARLMPEGMEQMAMATDGASAGAADGEIIDLTELTKDQLMERAKAAEIRGRSSMTKQQLADALSGKG